MIVVYDLLYDLLAIALLLKLLWDAELSLLPWGLIAAGVVGTPFLLGIGRRRGATVLRIGVGAAGLILFLARISSLEQGIYIGMLSISVSAYIFARLMRKPLHILIGVCIIVIVILYLIHVV